MVPGSTLNEHPSRAGDAHPRDGRPARTGGSPIGFTSAVREGSLRARSPRGQPEGGAGSHRDAGELGQSSRSIGESKPVAERRLLRWAVPEAEHPDPEQLVCRLHLKDSRLGERLLSGGPLFRSG